MFLIIFIYLRSGNSEIIENNNKEYTIDKLANEILKRKITNILCVVGAGISTPSGIPDFRYIFKQDHMQSIRLN